MRSKIKTLYSTGLCFTQETCSDAIYHEGLAATQQLQEAFNMEDIKPLVHFKLPFVVKQDFLDPYCPPPLEGYALASYPHENRGGILFHVFSVSMEELAAPRKKATPQHQNFGWNMPPPPQQPQPQPQPQQQNMNP